MTADSQSVAPAGVIVAGGRSQRMGGGDKFMRPLRGEPILGHVIARSRRQVRALVLNANGDPARLAAFGLPVVSDSVPGYVGPLAGILAGLDWAARQGSGWLASFTADAPFVPLNLVSRLSEAATGAGADIACAASGGRRHPAIALWRVGLRDPLRAAITSEQLYRVDTWAARYRRVEVDFPVDPIDPFLNINEVADLAAAESALSIIQSEGTT
jgi:molybdopterin-guanine dinucleotide biosynthesis protein A